MIIPEQVHLLYKDYEVKKTNNLRNDSGETLYGQTQYIEQLILINENASEEQQKATLIHELVHGLDELFGIELKEEQVEKLGNAFYMLIRDNLEMFKEGQMITISIAETSIHVLGHAGAGTPGQDIICAAVSTLTQSLISSVEELTEDKITYSISPGMVDIDFGELSEASRLLVDSFAQ